MIINIREANNMIKSNINIKVDTFPDKTKLIKTPDMAAKESDADTDTVWLTWMYSGDQEMAELFFTVKHLKALGKRVNLLMPYIPNARMDRVHNKNTEVFTLKYFCEFVNNLNIDRVLVFDPHSDVSTALLDRVEVISPKGAIRYTVALSEPKIVYFPDAGAMKRYGGIIKEIWGNCKLSVAYGNKVRDWDTGEIKGLEIIGEIPNGAKVIMIDDICSYGGTMYYSAKKLKELGAGDIEMYVSHCENSIIDPEKGKIFKEDGLINRVYTTDSILTVEHPKIKLVREFGKLDETSEKERTTFEGIIKWMFD